MLGLFAMAKEVSTGKDQLRVYACLLACLPTKLMATPARCKKHEGNQLVQVKYMKKTHIVIMILTAVFYHI